MDMKARIMDTSGGYRIVDVESESKNRYISVRLAKETIQQNCSYIDFLFDCFLAKQGDEGYFVLPLEAENGVYLTKFLPRKDTEYVSKFSCMSCYGWNQGTHGILAIVTGMKYDYSLVAGVQNGNYYVYPRFYMDGDIPYEDVSVRLYHMDKADYSAMAREYRRYQIEENGCVPLKERVKKDPRLKKSADSINIRVRQGWKPVPAPVEEQTLENEPEMHVACTFDRVGELMEECHAQGVRNAEFCLVGWNRCGHDGRFPQIFPVEPRLGGEERLKALIGLARSLGYGMVCHDDATAAYRIADCWDEEYILKNKDGSLYKRPKLWAGGRPYKICPQRQYERFETENMKKLSELGFEGIHYIDVITILELLKCYDQRHPCTRKDSAMWYRKIMRLARTTFGGFSSEGSYDFAAAELDYILYASFHLDNRNIPQICDESIPFWQIVYHGIILYNPGTYTLNYAVKKEDNRLKYFEYGGRPLAVFYANFTENDHWMGLEDLICDSDEQMRQSVAAVKQMEEDYELLRPVRYEFMEQHDQIGEGIFRTRYSNGVEVVVDYNTKSFRIAQENMK